MNYMMLWAEKTGRKRAWLMDAILLRLTPLTGLFSHFADFSDIFFFAFSGKLLVQMRENIHSIPKTRKS
jgi:hypothetical protein